MKIKKNESSLDLTSLYEQAIESMPVHIYWKDMNFQYIGCNLLQANDLGLKSIDEIIGKTDYDLLEKDTADIIRKNDNKIIMTGKPSIFEEPWANFVFLTQKIPLFDSLGKIIGLAGISFNITERKKREEKTIHEKRVMEQTLESIVDNLPGHVYWKDKQGVYLGCNLAQAKSAGFSSKQSIIGRTDYQMPWKKEADILRRSDLDVMTSRETITREEASQLVNADKTSIFLSKKSPLFDELGNVIGILGISFDITERKKIEEELHIAREAAEAASRAKSAFIANISHDTRTPLTGVIGLSQALEAEHIEDKERIEYAKLIHESGDSLLEFSERVLDDVTADALTEDKLIQEPFDVKRVMNDVIRLEHPTTEVSHIDIEMYVDPEIPAYLVGDKLKLHRILLNLTGNAIKFTKEGSVGLSARLLTRKKDRVKIEFSVKDTGIGIAPEHQSKVFDRFFKVTPSYKGLYTGYGLGLHIVKKFVNLMGGKIQLESKPGEGTKVSFILEMVIGEEPKNKLNFETLYTNV